MVVLIVSGYATDITPDLPNDVAHDWYGLATWALICLAFAFVARGYFKLKAGIDTTVGQVKNGHKDPLRADVDKLLVAAEENSTALGEIKSALAVETAARITAIEGVSERLGGIEEHLRGG